MWYCRCGEYINFSYNSLLPVYILYLARNAPLRNVQSLLQFSLLNDITDTDDTQAFQPSNLAHVSARSFDHTESSDFYTLNTASETALHTTVQCAKQDPAEGSRLSEFFSTGIAIQGTVVGDNPTSRVGSFGCWTLDIGTQSISLHRVGDKGRNNGSKAHVGTTPSKSHTWSLSCWRQDLSRSSCTNTMSRTSRSRINSSIFNPTSTNSCFQGVNNPKSPRVIYAWASRSLMLRHHPRLSATQ